MMFSIILLFSWATTNPKAGDFNEAEASLFAAYLVRLFPLLLFFSWWLQVLGFDCEWVSEPSDVTSTHRVSLIQLATVSNLCILIRIHQLDSFPDSLRSLLADRRSVTLLWLGNMRLFLPKSHTTWHGISPATNLTTTLRHESKPQSSLLGNLRICL